MITITIGINLALCIDFDNDYQYFSCVRASPYMRMTRVQNLALLCKSLCTFVQQLAPFLAGWGNTKTTKWLNHAVLRALARALHCLGQACRAKRAADLSYSLETVSKQCRSKLPIRPKLGIIPKRIDGQGKTTAWKVGWAIPGNGWSS